MLFSEMLERGQDSATAIVDSREFITYGEFRAAVAGFAAHLHNMGLAKGDRVAQRVGEHQPKLLAGCLEV